MRKTAGTATEPVRLSYRPSEAAEMLGVSRSTLYGWLTKRLIRAVRVGGTTLIPHEELQRFLREGLNRAE